MSEMIIGTLIGVALGGIITWIVTRHYYKKSMINAPEWARPLIDKLPQIAP